MGICDGRVVIVTGAARGLGRGPRARLRGRGRQGRGQRHRRRPRRVRRRRGAGGRGGRGDPGRRWRGDRQRSGRVRVGAQTEAAREADPRRLRPPRCRREQRRLRARPHVRVLLGRRVGRRDPACTSRATSVSRATRPNTGATSRRPARRSTRASSTRARARASSGSIGQSAYSAAKAGIATLTLDPGRGARALRHHRERHRTLGPHADDRGGLRRHDGEARQRIRRDGPRERLAPGRLAGLVREPRRDGPVLRALGRAKSA